MSKNFYIADTHFGHDNIRKLSNRPFATVEEMDRAIIDNWNSKVKNDDDVYILGDFTYKGKSYKHYLKQLNGHKHLIIGNHDTKTVKESRGTFDFIEVEHLLEVNDNGNQIVLCHYPLVEWSGYYRGTYHFYGHVHNTFHNETTRYAKDMKNAFNVGVDIIGFAPCTFDEIVKGERR